MSIQFAGGTIVNTTFTATTKATLQGNVITQLLAAGWSQATGPSGGGSQTVTISVASPGVVTLAAHGLLANDTVVFSTTGALPTGLSAGAVYYVKTVLSASTLTVSSTAGGTAINTSGTQSGTQSVVGTVRMATATTPWSVTSRVKIQDNGGNCITFSIANSTSTLEGSNSTTGGGFLLPGPTAFRVIADMYQAFVFLPAITPARGFVAFGTPYLPTFLQGVITECGWLSGNARSDTDTVGGASFRTLLALANSATPSNNQGIVNTNLMDCANNGSNPQSGCLMVLTPAYPAAGKVTGQTGIAWHDGSAIMYEPLIAWGNIFYPGTSSASAQPLIRGQLWDAVLIVNEFPGDTTTTFDGHNWWGVTDSDTADDAAIFIAVT